MPVSLEGLVEDACLDSVNRSEIAVENDRLVTNGEDALDKGFDFHIAIRDFKTSPGSAAACRVAW